MKLRLDIKIIWGKSSCLHFLTDQHFISPPSPHISYRSQVGTAFYLKFPQYLFLGLLLADFVSLSQFLCLLTLIVFLLFITKKNDKKERRLILNSDYDHWLTDNIGTRRSVPSIKDYMSVSPAGTRRSVPLIEVINYKDLYMSVLSAGTRRRPFRRPGPGEVSP